MIRLIRSCDRCAKVIAEEAPNAMPDPRPAALEARLMEGPILVFADLCDDCRDRVAKLLGQIALPKKGGE